MTFFSDLSKTFRAGVLLGVALALAVSLFAVPSASADYEQAPEHFGHGGEAEQLYSATGIAVNESGAGLPPGEVGSFYVTGLNGRVLRFAPGGEGEEPQFKEAWGWKTIESGPDLPAAEYAVTVSATSGTYTVRLAGTAEGEGTTTEGSNTVTGVSTSFGAFHVGDTIVSGGGAFPTGTKVTAVGAGTLELDAVAKAGKNGSRLINANETTAPIQATATAGEVQAALEALPGPGAGALAVSGGPGDTEGTNPYEILYEGPYTGVRGPPRLSATDIDLAGGVPSAAVAVVRIVDPNEGRYERCRPFAGDVCIPPPESGVASGGEETGHFEFPEAAVDQATGNVYVLNTRSVRRGHHLVEVFTATGAPVGEGFGDAAGSAASESIAEEPAKLHEMETYETTIAVNEAGTVYLNDKDYTGITDAQSRVMSFEPEAPGDYEHYVYAGATHDIRQEKTNWFNRIALVGTNRIVAAGKEQIREYALAEGGGAQSSEPLCTYLVPSGFLKAMTANPITGEVFYFADNPDRKLHRLGPCDPETGEFEEIQEPIGPSPETESLFALAVNPTLAWGGGRPAGVLYAADAEGHGPGEKGIGDVFIPAELTEPEVLGESVAHTSATASTLQAKIDPRGQSTRYRFEYLTQAAYEANEPDERQSLTVKATGGLFGLGFEGRALGGAFRADLAEGSATAEGLATALGTADLKAAAGTATLSGAVGKGAVIAGSKTVTLAATTEGAFAAGQTIEGAGIPAGATIASVSGSELTLSVNATESGAGVSLHAGTDTLSSLATSEGSFEAGMEVSGSGIPAGTTVASVSGATLTLSKPVTKPGTAVPITAGFPTLGNLAVSEGGFEAGMPISGEGIPAGTKIEAVHAASLELSKAPTKPGTAVAISSSGPLPLAVGESVEGPGIAPGTTIAATQAGKLTLSAPAEATEAGAQLRAGLPFDASASELQSALEGLATIGEGDVTVSGGPGDEAGSSPYEVTFSGQLTNQDLPELSADSAGLSGGAAEATLATAHDGGGGFAGAASTPGEEGTLGSGEAATVAAAATGLAPDTAYRFRVVASGQCGGACEVKGAAAALRTYPLFGAPPPDARAYELVSPAEKHGGEAFPADPGQNSCPSAECKPPGSTIVSVFPMQSSPSGDALAYMGYPFSPTQGAAVYNSYLARRTAAGWQSAFLSPALLATSGGENLAVGAAGLGGGLIYQPGSFPRLAPSAPAGYSNLYLQDTAGPASLAPLVGAAPPNRSAGAFALDYAGHSPDFSAHFFAANDALSGETPYAPAAPDPGSSGRELYEWRAGQLYLVNVLPGNAAVAGEAAFASSSPDAHAVSANGRRVFWHAGPDVYLREDGQITRHLAHEGSFLSASANGLEVLFEDGCLYSLLSEACTDLSQGEGGFQGIAGASEDLSRIYFADTAALPGSGENERGLSAQAGQPNLYLYEAGAPTRFIATLLPDDGATGTTGLGDWAAAPSQRGAQASPAGRYLAFASRAQLSGYDSTGPCERSNEGGWKDSSCAQVFLYDSASGQLTCPSCNPSGEAPLGESTLRRIKAERSWQAQPRYLTDSGRLFFDSQDRLSARDTNGRVEDVYEYEPNGLGSCARAGGCVALISPGTGAVDSNFLALDSSGANVFFTSRQRLVPADKDELIDVYDAREGGGFAAENEAAPGPCAGEACQGPQGTAPAQPQPGSSSYTGPGNPKQSQAKNCSKPAKQAQSLSKRAKQLRRNAKKVARHNPKKAARMRGKANNLAKQAKRKSNQAKSCRGGSSASRVTKRAHRQHRRARR